MTRASLNLTALLGVPVYFAPVERDDYDCIARYELNGEMKYVPVQLKELTPSHLPNPRTFQELLNKLTNPDSKDLVVAIFVNREFTLVPLDHSYPKDRYAELWLFGAQNAAQQRWFLLGNMLSEYPSKIEFSHPQFPMFY